VTATAEARKAALARGRLRTGGLVALVVGAIFVAGLFAGWRLERFDADRGFLAEAERIAGVLRLAPGISVGDIRAGTGRWTVAMARRVGPTGQVYATVGPNPAHELLRTVAEGGVDNVSVITKTPGDSPRLPLGCCEAILVRAVYHDFSDRRTLLASLRKNLKPGGLLAIIDFDEGTPEQAGGHGIARRTVAAEVTGAGFELRETHAHWSGNAFCLVFRQPASEARDPEP
jgi:SAM-dependent methyltransferase